MPKMYEYQGRRFQLPDGLSDAQAKDKITSFLATEEKVEEEKVEEPTLPQSGIYAGVERDVATTDASLPDEIAAEQSVGSGLLNTDKDYDPTKHEGVPLELLEGIASGVIGIGQGVGELVGAKVDLAFDTDVASYVTENANALRNELGIDPVGIVGVGAEVLTQFALPGIAAISAVSKLSKLGKLGATARAGG